MEDGDDTTGSGDAVRESGDGLAWETLASETAYTCPGFDVVCDDVRLPDGTETEFHYVSEPPSVVVLPFTGDGDGEGDGGGEGDDDGGGDYDGDGENDVVVIEEWRQAVDRVNYGLPAGGLEADDHDLEAAARRELAEETGYEAGTVEHVGTFEPSNGLFDSVFHYVVARGCTATTERDLDENESISVGTASFDSLRERALTGDLRDGRSALGILHYALRSDEDR